MAYYVLKDFARGLDARRLWETTEVGALIEGTNAHITRGGEVEVRRGFIKQRTLASGTHGLWVGDDGAITVFGHTTRPPLLASDVAYVQCAHPDGETAMHRVLSQDSFFGKPYIVAEFVDGTVHHFWNGTLILDSGVPIDYEPETPPPPGEDPEPPPAYQTGNGRPTAQISLYYSSGGGDPQITGVVVGRVLAGESRDFPGQLIDRAWNLEKISIVDPAEMPLTVDSQNVAEAVKKLADLINAYPAVTCEDTPVKFHAAASFNQLTVSADEYNSRLNGWRVKISASTSLASDPPGRVASFSGGQDLPPPVPPPGSGQIENPEPVPPEFRWSPGRFATSHRQKVYATSDTLLHFSAIDNATLWTPDATGAGFIDVTTHSKGSQHLVSLGEYQNFLAVFARKQIQLWAMDPDPRRNQLAQVLHNTGTFAARSTIEFGSGELIYLDLSGIRAISARTVENVAYMSDIGSMIDKLVTDQLSTLDATVASKAIGLVEPQDGRLWMIVGDRIYVLSYFPSAKVSAWTVYKPGFIADYADVTATHVWLRAGNDIYCYGGLTGIEYEDVEAVVQVPYLDFQRPATTKTWNALDVAIEGEWLIEVGMDPTRPQALATVGTLDKSSYSYGRIAMYGSSTHVSLRFTHTGASAARIGSAALHYQESEAG